MPEFFLDFELTDLVQLSLKSVLIYLFLLWVALTVWVARDVVGRTRNIPFQVFAIIITIVLNIFGLLLYLIIRPQKTLLERYYEELEQQELSTSSESCGECGEKVSLEYRYCPACGSEEHHPCKKCKKLLSREWKVCVYCGKKVEEEKKKTEGKK